MIQPTRRASLALEASQAFGVPRELARKHFDGDITLDPRIAGAIDGSHAACADRGNNFVGPQAIS